MEKLIEKLKKASLISELEEAHNEIISFVKDATDEQKEILRQVVEEKSQQLMKDVSVTKAKAQTMLKELESDIYFEKDGIKYNLNEWLTPSEYAKKYSIKTAQVVSNWISRGIIPDEKVLKINRLNIQLVKDIRYK